METTFIRYFIFCTFPKIYLNWLGCAIFYLPYIQSFRQSLLLIGIQLFSVTLITIIEASTNQNLINNLQNNH